MKKRKFKARLFDAGGGGVYVLVPFDVAAVYGQKNLIKIVASIDGVTYRGSIANMGNGPCLPVLKAIRAEIGKQVGDEVTIEIEKDELPRVVEIPTDFLVLLNAHPTEKRYFNALSYTHQKEYIRWITEAKRDATRINRITKAIELLKEKSKI